MPTLSEYAKLSQDELEQSVYENIITENALAPLLQFEEFSGNSLLYDRENTLPTSATHTVGDIWSDSDATYTQKSATLTEVGVQSSLPRYVSQTRGNVMSQEAQLFKGMAKSLMRKIANLIITGEPEATTTHWEGLDSLCRSETRMMAMDDGVVDGPGAAETELTLDRFDAFSDLIEKGDPDAYVMNKTMRRKLTALSRDAGSGVVMDSIEMFGHQVSTYNHIPIIINDHITNSEQYNDTSTWTSSTATSIFALKFGKDNQGYTIIHNGPVMSPDIQELGTKFDKNEDAFRMAVYIQAITYSAKMVASLGGIDSAA